MKQEGKLTKGFVINIFVFKLYSDFYRPSIKTSIKYSHWLALALS